MSSNLFSEQLILASRNPQMKLGPFDGKVAAHITMNPNEQLICTTPNQDIVPCPPYTTVHSLRIRADLRYSIHDHTLFLQPYVAYYSHLGAIPRKPTNEDHPLSIIWWNLTPNDFIALTGGILLGTGSLATNTLNAFQTMEQQHALDLIATIATTLSNALICLSSLQTTYTQMRFTITEFQHYYLELVRLLDYMEIYQPRMRGQVPAASSVDDCIGVFTLNEVGGPFESNVLEIVSPTPSDARMDDYDPPFPTIYTGLLGGCDVVDAIHHFSHNWLSYKDPFEGNSVRHTPGPSSTAPSSSSLAHSTAPISKQHTKP
ncbi:hypothetical protein BJ165DRAFT_1533811 [Panaeolus papilionaceus]|nr:hypothetical protein BJ165DRAFT_1533811 [Panaeolus papilionaceus]